MSDARAFTTIWTSSGPDRYASAQRRLKSSKQEHCAKRNSYARKKLRGQRPMATARRRDNAEYVFGGASRTGVCATGSSMISPKPRHRACRARSTASPAWRR
eukprot:9304027-Alexandrium_andersonii.AAC.1